MNIKRMTATFGRLSGQTLTLAPGFNLVEAPNEGGKSTWAAFLKAMLYGIDTRDRDKKGYLADKNRYQPWSGAPMEGELVLEWQGRDITIRRSPRGNTPFGAFSAVYTGRASAALSTGALGAAEGVGVDWGREEPDGSGSGCAQAARVRASAPARSPDKSLFLFIGNSFSWDGMESRIVPARMFILPLKGPRVNGKTEFVRICDDLSPGFW